MTVKQAEPRDMQQLKLQLYAIGWHAKEKIAQAGRDERSETITLIASISDELLFAAQRDLVGHPHYDIIVTEVVTRWQQLVKMPTG